MKFSTILLPNRAFRERMSTVDPRTRRVYWALRITLIALVLLIAAYFITNNPVPKWRRLG